MWDCLSEGAGETAQGSQMARRKYEDRTVDEEVNESPGIDRMRRSLCLQE